MHSSYTFTLSMKYTKPLNAAGLVVNSDVNLVYVITLYEFQAVQLFNGLFTVLVGDFLYTFYLIFNFEKSIRPRGASPG